MLAIKVQHLAGHQKKKGITKEQVREKYYSFYATANHLKYFKAPGCHFLTASAVGMF